MAFRRIEFFKGFFTRADDWQAAETYHSEKRKLHNRTLHEPGIVDGLTVKADASGRAVIVGRGVATDKGGREIVLEQEETKVSIPFDSGKDTIYVVLQSHDEKVDFRQDVANPDYSGYAFTEERAEVTTITDAPGESSVVLARIKLTAGAQKIRDANDAERPGDDEIDLRVRKGAGSIVSTVSIGQIAELVLSGSVAIPASRGSADQEYTARAWAAGGEGHSFHFASVYPTSGHDADVSWRLGSSRKGAALEYRLFIRNHSRQDIEVAYRVFRVRG